RAERSGDAGDENMLTEMLCEIGPHAMDDGKEGEEQRRQGKPGSGAEERRPQPANRLCVRSKSGYPLRSRDHVDRTAVPSTVLRVPRARCVATFNAAIDIPLAAAASFSDISSSFNIWIACRCPDGRASMAARNASASDPVISEFDSTADKVSCCEPRGICRES